MNSTIEPKKTSTFALLGAIGAALLLGGCGDNPKEPVQITLCKTMLTEKVKPAGEIEWTEVSTHEKRLDSMTVQVTLLDKASGKHSSASCAYEYDVVEEDATIDADPTQAYSTYPERVLIEGDQLADRAMDALANSAMIKQGKAFAKEVKDGAKRAAKDIGDGAKKAAEQIGNDAQNAFDQIKQTLED